MKWETVTVVGGWSPESIPKASSIKLDWCSSSVLWGGGRHLGVKCILLTVFLTFTIKCACYNTLSSTETKGQARYGSQLLRTTVIGIYLYTCTCMWLMQHPDCLEYINRSETTQGCLQFKLNSTI